MEVSAQASVSAVASTPPNQAIPRRSANFHPSVWGEYFLKYTSDPKEYVTVEEEIEHSRLKKEVRNMLNGIPDKSRRKLELIDNIQRLALCYHFETEIEASLLNIYNAYNDRADAEENDLHAAAVRFRLLRQNGHCISCDHAFRKFKDTEGKLIESTVNDLKGMLSLYEASHFRAQGENFLEEALKFSTTQLESMMPNLSHFHATQVKQALDQPIRKKLTRLGGLQYIPIYQEDESHNDALLKLAKLDFNRLQKLHQMELSEITRWWKELDPARNFPFARDRIAETYFWILGVYFEPHYGLARRFLAKAMAVSSIIDDIYDVHGTLDELVSFTAAIERWAVEAINQLPTYMRHFYQVVLDVYTEMEEELANKGISDRVNYAKEELKKLAQAYIQEAYWCRNACLPTFEEGLEVSLVSCGYRMLAATAMVGMGDSATKESFDWVINDPLIVRAASVICRLTDDIVGYESEKERGDVAFTVECYKKEYGVSKQEAFDELKKRVTDAWKDINTECLTATAVSTPILERILNLARVIDLLYREEDGYTNSRTKTKELITLLLVEPVRL